MKKPKKSPRTKIIAPAKKPAYGRQAPALTGRLPIKISNPDKVYWPEEGYTKLQLVEFYAAIFPKLRPYVDDRMLSLERCPDGMRGGCFYQKEARLPETCTAMQPRLASAS